MTSQDPALRQRVRSEVINREIASQIHQMRTAAGMTQSELARRIGTTQSVISRLEDADYEGHSLPMLERIAEALSLELRVSFVKRQA